MAAPPTSDSQDLAALTKRVEALEARLSASVNAHSLDPFLWIQVLVILAIGSAPLAIIGLLGAAR